MAGLVFLSFVVVFLVVVGVLLYRMLVEPLIECNHIYTLYSPTASACAICGKEHPDSNKMPTLNQYSQIRHWR